jgi:hypothetical protein
MTNQFDRGGFFFAGGNHTHRELMAVDDSSAQLSLLLGLSDAWYT